MKEKQDEECVDHEGGVTLRIHHFHLLSLLWLMYKY